jgi:hypothetical protein
LQYSTDGSNFTNVVDYLVPVITWNNTTPNVASMYSQNLSSISGVNNQASVYFRLMAILPPLNSGGQSRVDNILVTGIPEPSSLVMAILAIAVVATLRKTRIA